MSAAALALARAYDAAMAPGGLTWPDDPSAIAEGCERAARDGDLVRVATARGTFYRRRAAAGEAQHVIKMIIPSL